MTDGADRPEETNGAVDGPATGRPTVALGPDLVGRYRLCSLYNSPYVAHEWGRAVDLYPDRGAPSPVAGEVLATRSLGAPDRPHAEDRDHLILIAVADGDLTPRASAGRVDPAGLPDDRRPAAPTGSDGERGDHRVTDRTDLVARVLHVDPAVEAGDRVAVGDDLGRTIRSGYFAPWVEDHLHVGFRPPGADHRRARGSLPVALDAPVAPVDWDGWGTVVDAGDTYAQLDRPVHPAPGSELAGIAAGRRGGIGGRETGGPPAGVLDGGFPHYDRGGLLTADPGGGGARSGAATVLGSPAATPTGDGRTVEWHDRTVLVDGRPVTGLSLYLGRDRAGARIVCPDRSLSVGDSVRVRIGD